MQKRRAEEFPSTTKELEARRRARREIRRKRRRRQVMTARIVVGAIGLILLACVGFGLYRLGSFLWRSQEGEETVSVMQEREIIKTNRSEKPEISEELLTPNEYSRPGDELPEVTELFVHYTANAGTSAAQNRSYFENLGITGETSASSHFIIEYEGEIIQCLPLNEIGYSVKEHNFNSISIECCYLDEDGKFTDATYDSLIRLLGWLMKEYDLGISSVKRHYDAGGKPCPIYYVEHEDAWNQLKKDLKEYIL